LSSRTEENDEKITVNIADILAEIRTERLSNINVEHYRCASLPDFIINIDPCIRSLVNDMTTAVVA
jgi:hypothetical protein